MGDSSESLPPRNEQGFLDNVADWTPLVCKAMAAEEGLSLDEARWEIILLLRDYYEQYDSSPAMRALVKYVRQRLGEEKGRSIYLLTLFPDSPARLAAKLAGLPKPANCL
ncbi:MAG: TusE/DsrC/DsvC family sulfur relay protein [Pseudomonadota bacterium]